MFTSSTPADALWGFRKYWFFTWTSLVAQLVENLPAMLEILGWQDLLEKE